MNLKYMKVSLFEITYKKKITFSRHSNLLRCTCIYIYIYIHTHTWSELLVPLVNMIKEGCGNKCALLILFIYYLKNSQKSKLSLENKNLKWGGKYDLFFSNTHWTQLTAPFYSILFETSIYQNSIGVFSYNA